MIMDTDRLPAATSVRLIFNIKLIAALNAMTKFLKGENSLKGFDLCLLSGDTTGISLKPSLLHLITIILLQFVSMLKGFLFILVSHEWTNG